VGWIYKGAEDMSRFLAYIVQMEALTPVGAETPTVTPLTLTIA